MQRERNPTLGNPASVARPGLDERLGWGWSWIREMGHHAWPAGASHHWDGGSGALRPFGRAQEPAREDHNALAIARSPKTGSTWASGISDSRRPGTRFKNPGAFLTRGNRFYWFVTILAATAVAALIMART